MNVTTIGLDLAKNIFHACAVDQNGKVCSERTLKRKDLLATLAQVPACVIAMESGSGAHHWARSPRELGHDPSIIDAAFVATRSA